jgi:hypothetical protein
MAHLGVQNDLYCEVKWLMLQGKMTDIVTHWQSVRYSEKITLCHHLVSAMNDMSHVEEENICLV